MSDHQQPCGCCEGTESLTPLAIANRPGLDHLKYRVGTHGTILESLMARLSAMCDGPNCATSKYSLRERLTTRNPNDPAIALLDACATVGDVLTFYQERLANEGFLRTAITDGSIYKLARLVGYQPRPGVASTALLAFNVEFPASATAAAVHSSDSNLDQEIIIPPGTAVKSSPAPGTNELPQTFETISEFVAREEWNEIRPRQTRPHRFNSHLIHEIRHIFLKGIGLQLTAGSVLGFRLGVNTRPVLRLIESVREEPATDRTMIVLGIDDHTSTSLMIEIRLKKDEFLNNILVGFQTPAQRVVFQEKVQVAFKDFSEQDALVSLDKRLSDELIYGQLSDKGAALHKHVSELLKDLENITKYIASPLIDKRMCVHSLFFQDLSELTNENRALVIQELVNDISELTTVGSKLFCDVDVLLMKAIAGFYSKRATSTLLCSLAPKVVVPILPIPEPIQLSLRSLKSNQTYRLQIELIGNPNVGKLLKPDGSEVISIDKTGDVETLQTFADSIKIKATASERFQIQVSIFSGEEFQDKVFSAISTYEVGDTGNPPSFRFYSDDQSSGLLVFKGKAVPVASDIIFTDLPPEGYSFKIEIDTYTTAPQTQKEFKRDDYESVEEFIKAIQSTTFDFTRERTPLTTLLYELVVDGKSFVLARQIVIPTNISQDLIGQVLVNLQKQQVHSFLTKKPFNIDALKVELRSISELIKRIKQERKSITYEKIITQTVAAAIKVYNFIKTLDSASMNSVEYVKDHIRALLLKGFKSLEDKLTKAFKESQEKLDSIEEAESDEVKLFLTSTVAKIFERYERKRIASPKPEEKCAEMAKAFEDLINDVKNSPAADFGNVGSQVEDLGEKLLQLLINRRKQLLQRARLRINRYKTAFKHADLINTVGLVEEAFKKSEEEFDKEVLPGSGEPVSRLYLSDAICGIRLQVGEKCSCNGLSACNVQGSTLHESTKLPLKDSERVALKSLISDFKVLITQVSEPAPGISGQKQENTLDLKNLLDKFREFVAPGEEGNDTSQSSFARLIAANSDLIPQLVRALNPEERRHVASILRKHEHKPSNLRTRIDSIPTKSRCFGWNAPLKVPYTKKNKPGEPRERKLNIIPNHPDREFPRKLFLDNAYGDAENGLVAIAHRDELEGYVIENVKTRPRSAYGLSSECTELMLLQSWWSPGHTSDANQFDVIRGTRIFCESVEIPLAMKPISDELPVRGKESEIELDDLYIGLSSGKLILVEGVPVEFSEDATNVKAEHVRIGAVRHELDDKLYGDRFHTVVELEEPLRHTYHRTTVKIYANVVEASHGETQQEVMGAGNGADFQRFFLKQPPLTFLTAPTTSGTRSSLDVFVNDVKWQEEDDFRGSKPQNEHFVTRTDESGNTIVVFGDGEKGARPATGIENVRATYRTGMGKSGNVDERRIDQVARAPMGVKGVINPLPARGGADGDRQEEARRRTPMGLTALDRLVSVQDYADFVLTFAGIGKASSAAIDGTVHVTIAGMVDEPVDVESDHFRNLNQAINEFGGQSFQLHNREALLLVIAARVKIKPHYQWKLVEQEIRVTLLKRFRYEQSDLGQDVLLSDAIATIQAIDGVLFVDVDKFDAVDEDRVFQLNDKQPTRLTRIHVGLATTRSVESNSDSKIATVSSTTRVANELANNRNERSKIRPAQLCYLTPDVPDTLILEQIS